MRRKRFMATIYSSALVLGLSFLLYPQMSFRGKTAVSTENVTPGVPATPTLTPAPTPTSVVQLETPTVALKPTPSPDPTATPKPELKLPTLLVANELLTPLPGVQSAVTAYIQAYYKNDFETLSTLVTDASLLNKDLIEKNTANIKKADDIKLYAKPGVNGIFSIVYATFSVYYEDNPIPLPQYAEYYVKHAGNGVFQVETVPLSSETRAAFQIARRTEVVRNLYIPTLIKRYHNASLTVNESVLNSCVTNTDYLDVDYIASRYSVTESFSDYEFYVYSGINEFDYVVFTTYNEKIVFSDTPAPCFDSYCIDINDYTGFPSIFYGEVADETEAYLTSLVNLDVIRELKETTDQKMQEAALADDDLYDFLKLINASASEG